MRKHLQFLIGRGQDYLNDTLTYTSMPVFMDGNEHAFDKWDFGHIDPTGAQVGKQVNGTVILYTAGDLAATMSLNKDLKVLSVNGYVDSVTPFSQTTSDLQNMPLSDPSAPNERTTVARGETYLHPSLARVLVAETIGPKRHPGAPVREALSEREAQVLRLVALGHTSQHIAEQLFLSIRTVETYKGRTMDKLGLRGRAEVVHYALESGLLQQDEAG